MKDVRFEIIQKDFSGQISGTSPERTFEIRMVSAEPHLSFEAKQILIAGSNSVSEQDLIVDVNGQVLFNIGVVPQRHILLINGVENYSSRDYSINSGT